MPCPEYTEANDEPYDEFDGYTEKIASNREEQVTVSKNYAKSSLVDLVVNSLEIVMSSMRRNGLPYNHKTNFQYYVEFFNCCRKEELVSAVAPDVRQRLLAIHVDFNIRKMLASYTGEEYELATLVAARKKKEDIMKFWNEYVETSLK